MTTIGYSAHPTDSTASFKYKNLWAIDNSPSPPPAPVYRYTLAIFYPLRPAKYLVATTNSAASVLSHSIIQTALTIPTSHASSCILVTSTPAPPLTPLVWCSQIFKSWLKSQPKASLLYNNSIHNIHLQFVRSMANTYKKLHKRYRRHIKPFFLHIFDASVTSVSGEKLISIFCTILDQISIRI